jgi:hypothetical protein
LLKFQFHCQHARNEEREVAAFRYVMRRWVTLFKYFAQGYGSRQIVKQWMAFAPFIRYIAAVCDVIIARVESLAGMMRFVYEQYAISRRSARRAGEVRRDDA